MNRQNPAIARWALIFTAISLSRSLVNFAILPVLLMLLNPSEFSTIVLLTPVWWIAQSLLTMGANEGIGRVAVDRTEGVFTSTILSLLVGSALTALVALALMEAAPSVLGLPFGLSVLFALLTGLAQATISSSVTVLRNVQDMLGACASLALAALLPSSVGLIGIFSSNEPSAKNYLGGLLAGSIIAATYALYRLARTAGVEGSGAGGVYITALRMGLPLLPQLLAGLVVDLAARRFVSEYGSVTDIAAYGLAVAAAGAISTIIKSAYLAWSPSFFRSNLGDRISFTRNFATLALSIALTLFAAGSIILLALSHLAPTLNGVPTQSIAASFLITGTSAAFAIPVMALSNLYLRDGKTKGLGLPVTAGAALGILAAAGIVSYPFWPAAGLAPLLASLFSALLAVRVNTNRSRRFLGFRFMSLMAASIAFTGAAFAAVAIDISAAAYAFLTAVLLINSWAALRARRLPLTTPPRELVR